MTTSDTFLAPSDTFLIPADTFVTTSDTHICAICENLFKAVLLKTFFFNN